MSRSKHWYFTSAFFPEGDLLSDLSSSTRYVFFSKKSEPVPHIEGIVYFEERKRLSQCLSLFPQAKWVTVHDTGRTTTEHMASILKGSCSQSGSPPKVNKKGTLRGHRTDWSRLKEDIAAGVSDEDLKSRYPGIFARYHSCVSELRSRASNNNRDP